MIMPVRGSISEESRDRKAVFGVPGKSRMLSIALAGKPNAGKSTFYTAATRADVDVANYPFTTIDANRGVTHARTDCPCLDRDERCDSDNCRDGKRYVPIELLDVAGLVPGAHEGNGLGNQFLDELTNADAIVNVVDASGGTNEEGEPVEVGEHDPMEDIDFVEEEMDLWLAGIVDDNWESVTRKSRSPDFDIDEALAEMLTGFGATEADVAASLRALDYPDDPHQWTDEDREALARDVRERTKPIIVAANKIDVAPEENVERLLGLDKPVIPTTAEGELALRNAADAGVVDYDPGDAEFDIVGDVSDEQRAALDSLREMMAEHGGTGVQAALNHAVYDLLDRVTAYPVQDASKWTDATGTVLPDAFLLPRGSTPVDLAYAVHSDIGDGYLHAVNGRTDREVGEGYELEAGDVIKIVSTN
jgi:ribosome-binding ATPase YchF (GTP1/OBG family)